MAGRFVSVPMTLSDPERPDVRNQFFFNAPRAQYSYDIRPIFVRLSSAGIVSKRMDIVRSPSLCLLAGPPRFFQIEIEVYLYTTLIASHPYYPMSVC